jgi:hypothetical protein
MKLWDDLGYGLQAEGAMAVVTGRSALGVARDLVCQGSQDRVPWWLSQMQVRHCFCVPKDVLDKQVLAGKACGGPC